MNSLVARDQLMSNLERANEVRFARAALKRELRSMEVLPGDVLLGVLPPWLEGVTIFEFLTWLPRVGAKRADALLRHRGLHPHTPLGQMTERQIHAACGGLSSPGVRR